MSTTIYPADVCESVTRQAKRLSDRLNLKLSTSQKVLAVALYRCAGWADLKHRLNSKRINVHISMLASLPKSDDANTYLNNHIYEIANALSQHMLTNSNRAGLYETLRYVFGVPLRPIVLSDLALSVPISSWKSMGIGPDPEAVIWASANINGLPIRLIATRIFMPTYYQFGEDISCPPEFAEPVGKEFQILWSNPSAWFEAAHRYLTLADDEDEDIESSLPFEVLDDVMTRHQVWFSRIAKTWVSQLTYGDEYTQREYFLPFIRPKSGCYLVFGIPTASPIDATQDPLSFNLSGEHNDSLLVTIDGQPACVEWISVNSKTHRHEGEYQDYFMQLSESIFTHPECDLDVINLKGDNGSYLFVRPATQFDIDHHLKVRFEHKPGKEAIVLKTDHPEIAGLLFDKIAVRDVMRAPSDLRKENYLVELDVSACEGVNGFSLSLEAKGPHWGKFRHLVVRSSLRIEGIRKILYLVVDSQLLSLADMVPKKDLVDAVHCGWILHRQTGFTEHLQQPPKRCENLKSAPTELVEFFEAPLSIGKDVSFFDILRNMTSIQYSRDNH